MLDESVARVDPSPEQTQTVPPDALQQKSGIDSVGETERLLSKAGFDSHLLSEIQSWTNWKSILELPLADALKEITIGLSDRFRATSVIETTDRVALLGAPGWAKPLPCASFWHMRYS